jgi:hypothetical protein
MDRFILMTKLYDKDGGSYRQMIQTYFDPYCTFHELTDMNIHLHSVMYTRRLSSNAWLFGLRPENSIMSEACIVAEKYFCHEVSAQAVLIPN